MVCASNEFIERVRIGDRDFPKKDGNGAGNA